jgi:outer membrane protein insertion porin family
MKATHLIISVCVGLAAPTTYGQGAESVVPNPRAGESSSGSTLELQATQFRLGSLEFKGNSHTREAFLRWIIPLVPGDIFDQSKWELGLDQLNRLGLFEPISKSDASFTFDYAQGLVDVELKLTERDRQRIDLSGGGGTSGGLNLGLDYSNINLNGVADRLTAQLRVGNRERSFGAGYSITLLRNSPITFELSGFYRRLSFVDARNTQDDTRPLFVERTAGASFGIAFPVAASRHRIASPTRFSFHYSFASTNLADTLQPQAGGSARTLEQRGIRIASITPALEHSSLDRQSDPLSGQQLRVATEVSARVLGGSFNTLRPLIDYRRFFPIGSVESRQAEGGHEPHVVGFRTRFSHIAGIGRPLSREALSSVRGIPIFKRFFLGGESEVRGYDVNSIAPLARVERILTPDGEDPVLLSSEIRPIGGDTQFVANAEYRVPIVWRLSAAAFADFGASFNLHRVREERFESRTVIQPTGKPATIMTVLSPLSRDARLPAYRFSLGGELRFLIPVFNVPIRFIVAANPNAQRRPVESVLVAPEKKFFFGVGFTRTL